MQYQPQSEIEHQIIHENSKEDISPTDEKVQMNLSTLDFNKDTDLPLLKTTQNNLSKIQNIQSPLKVRNNIVPSSIYSPLKLHNRTLKMNKMHSIRESPKLNFDIK